MTRFKAGNVRFITLTLKDNAGDLGDNITRLYECFAKLRRSKLWLSSQVGGAATLEIKYSSKRQGWHPHLHVVAEGKYIDQAELAQRWFRLTGDSYIVDVRIIKDPTKAARYVTKYISKGVTSEAMAEPSRAQEVVMQLRGRRLLTTFGTWRTLRLTASTAETDWECVGSLSELRELYRLGDSRAVMILNELARYSQYGPKEKEKTCTSLYDSS